MDSQSQKLRFFLTTPHKCNYIDGQEATSLFADPLYPKDKPLYSMLVANGFRRSGEHLYKPHCVNCSESRSVYRSRNFNTDDNSAAVTRKIRIFGSTYCPRTFTRNTLSSTALICRHGIEMAAWTIQLKTITRTFSGPTGQIPGYVNFDWIHD